VNIIAEEMLGFLYRCTELSCGLSIVGNTEIRSAIFRRNAVRKIIVRILHYVWVIFLFLVYILQSVDNTKTRPGVGRSGAQILVEARYSSLLKNVNPGFGAHPPSY
jgi:hypothetical protein